MMLNKILLFSFLSLSVSVYSQKIEKSKKQLTEKTTNSSNSSVSQSSESRNSNTPFLADLFVQTFLYVGYYSVIGHHKLEGHLQNSLSDYPYKEASSGNYTDSIGKRFRLDLENSLLFENLGTNRTSWGNHFKIKGRATQFIYGQIDHHLLFEKYAPKNDLESLSIVHFNLGYDRLRFKKFNLGFLLGATHIGSGVNKTGFNFGLNADAFVMKNISVTSTIQLSSVNQQTVNSFELKGRYHKKNYFVSTGFESLKIASPNYNYFALGGGIYF
jgi:hypothetical protein